MNPKERRMFVAKAIFNAHPTNHLWEDAKETNREVYGKRADAAIEAADATAPAVQVPVDQLNRWRVTVVRAIDLTHNPQLQQDLRYLLGDIKQQLAAHRDDQT